MITLIEVKPRKWGWCLFESPSVEPVFLQKDQAIGYAETRARLLAWVSLRLRLYSPVNLGLFITICTMYVIKSIVEEGFLRHDPAYAVYMSQVRYRFIPGIV